MVLLTIVYIHLLNMKIYFLYNIYTWEEFKCGGTYILVLNPDEINYVCDAKWRLNFDFLLSFEVEKLQSYGLTFKKCAWLVEYKVFFARFSCDTADRLWEFFLKVLTDLFILLYFYYKIWLKTNKQKLLFSTNLGKVSLNIKLE